MSQVTENGILEQTAFEDFKARSWGLKFKQALLQGVGGAMVFGVVGALMGIFISGAVLSATAMWAAGAFFAAAVGCIGLGSKFMFESQILDQDFQAKKIAAATSQGRSIALQHEPVRSHTTPPGMEVQRLHAEEVHGPKWAERVGHASKEAHHEKKEPNVPKPHVDSWAEEVRHSEHAEQTAPSIH